MTNAIKKIALPFCLFKRKFPLLSFILSRIITMLVILFVLGFVVFGLMELAPGDIVDQLMTQQLFSDTSRANSAAQTTDDSFSAGQFEQLRSDLGLDQPFYIQ
ncbi:MAG: ABC transporter permease, partial [Spirochaetaceae bacterium]|nr:ABC transporter permease [Spirochaetaceae bacterium]